MSCPSRLYNLCSDIYVEGLDLELMVLPIIDAIYHSSP